MVYRPAVFGQCAHHNYFFCIFYGNCWSTKERISKDFSEDEFYNPAADDLWKVNFLKPSYDDHRNSICNFIILRLSF